MKDKQKSKALASIIQGAGAGFIVGMIGYVLMFFFKLFAARVLGVDSFGLFEMLVTITSLIAVIGGFGLRGGVNRYIPYYFERKEYGYASGFLKFTFALQLAVSIAVAFALYFLAPFITSLFDFTDNFTRMLEIIAFFIPLAVINKTLTATLTAKKQIFKAKMPLNVLERVVLLIGILVIYLFELSVVTLALFFALAHLVNFVYLFFYHKKFYKKKSKPFFNRREWLLFSLPLLFSGFLAFFMRWTDNLMVGYYMSSADLGVYAIAYSLATYVIFFPKVANSIVIPVLSELYASSKGSLESVFFRVKSWTFIACSFVAIPLIVFSREVLLVLFGSEFVGGQWALVVLSSLLLLSTYFYFNNVLLMIVKKTGFILVNTLVFLTLNVVLNIVLIPLLGILGAAIATGSSLFLLRFGEYLGSRRYVEPDRDYTRITKLFAFIPLGIVLLYLLRELLLFISPHVIIAVIVALALYSLIYISLLFLLKVFDEEDFKAMNEVEKKSGLNLAKLKKLVKKLV